VGPTSLESSRIIESGDQLWLVFEPGSPVAEDASLWRERCGDALRMARSWAAAKLRCFLQRLEPCEIRTSGSSLTKKSSALSTLSEVTDGSFRFRPPRIASIRVHRFARAPLRSYYPGKEVGQAFQPDKAQSQAGKPDLQCVSFVPG
jgi:hypothetical protein